MNEVHRIKALLGSSESAGGVADEAIREAEEKIGVLFPRSYRAFLAEYGNVRGTLHEIAGSSRETANDDEPPYWWDVVACNLQLRRTASGLIPDVYVLISDDGGDYTFYLDTSRLDSQGECPVIALGPGVDAVVVTDNLF